MQLSDDDLARLLLEDDVEEELKKAFGNQKKIDYTTAKKAFFAILGKFGLYREAQMKRCGRLDLHRQMLCLFIVDQSGFRLLPLKPGQTIDILADDGYTFETFSVIQDEETGRPSLDCDEDYAPLGRVAKMPVYLAPAEQEQAVAATEKFEALAPPVKEIEVEK